MKRCGWSALVTCIPAIAPAATAQETATWLWDVTTDDGDALVEPGETATVTMSLDMHPDVDGLTVIGFAGTTFDVLGSAGAPNGTVLDWQILNDLDHFVTDESFTDGVSILNVEAAQLLLGPFSGDDPIDILEFQWTTDDYSGYAVTYETSTASSLGGATEGKVDVIVDLGDGAEAVLWDAVETSVTFQVVPGPASVLPLLGAGGVLARRCRTPLATGRSM